MVTALAASRRGRGRRLVLVHGFTQTRRSWDPIAERLAGDCEVVAVDAPGHGDSAMVRADLIDGAALLGAAGGRATYVGYSMGGRLALHLALTHPNLVEALVLIGATAGIEDDGERAARRQADDELAATIERDGVDAFLDRWLAQPLFATLPPAAAGRAERAGNTATALAASLRLAGTGRQASLWPRLGELRMPVLLVAGERDGTYAQLGRRMAGAIPRASVVIVPGAGHSVHLERPDEFLDALRRWLANQPPIANPTPASTP